ncbi:MAG: hypothetical protein HC800_02415 [Phormidesmis sp. RL_2_1]|nr:hypothetical protein [Phormidesmis sp. RL_2_1]
MAVIWVFLEAIDFEVAEIADKKISAGARGKIGASKLCAVQSLEALKTLLKTLRGYLLSYRFH